MNAPIRRVGFALIVLMVALVGQLSYVQIVRAHDLANDPRNIRVTRREIARPRGVIITIDGVVIAKSVKVADDLKSQRTYPLGPLYAQITGFQSLLYGTTGVERRPGP